MVDVVVVLLLLFSILKRPRSHSSLKLDILAERFLQDSKEVGEAGKLIEGPETPTQMKKLKNHP